MKTNDDELKRDLAAATGRDLPDEDEFAARVMDGVEGGGGERVLSAALPRRATPWRAAAAALLAGILIGALFLGRGGGLLPFAGPAAPGELDLPAADTGEALPGPIRIRVTAGENPDYEALRERLIAATRPSALAPVRLTARLADVLFDSLKEEVKPDILETKPIEGEERVIEDPVIKDAEVRDENAREAPDEISDEPFVRGNGGAGEFRFRDSPQAGRPAHHLPSERDVILFADRSVPWRTIQWILQTCADPDIALTRIHWAVEGDRAIPVFLPSDRGLAGAHPPGREQGRMSLRLARRAGENASAVEYGGRDLGEGPEGFENLRAALEFAPPSSLEVDASANVPFGEVVHAVDLARKAGCRTFTLVGAPPRKK